METLNIQLSRVLLNIEADIWTTNLTLLSLKTLLESLRVLEVKDLEEFYEQLKSFLITIKTTTPRIWIMVLHFSEIYDEIQDNKSRIKTLDDIHAILDWFIIKIEKELEEDTDKIVKNWVKIIEKNDNILIHSPSSMVKWVLKKSVEEWKKFRVTLALQSEEKTENMIMFLQNLKIPFVVVPEFMLSNVATDIDKMFVWWITFNSEYKFIASTWVDAAVSEIHYAHKKVYMFMSTKKFSLWQTEVKKDHTVHKLKQITSSDSRIKPYDRIKFSHDRIEVNLFDNIITEKGIMTPDEVKKDYDDSYKNRKLWRDKHSLPEDSRR